MLVSGRKLTESILCAGPSLHTHHRRYVLLLPEGPARSLYVRYSMCAHLLIGGPIPTELLVVGSGDHRASSVCGERRALSRMGNSGLQGHQGLHLPHASLLAEIRLVFSSSYGHHDLYTASYSRLFLNILDDLHLSLQHFLKLTQPCLPVIPAPPLPVAAFSSSHCSFWGTTLPAVPPQTLWSLASGKNASCSRVAATLRMMPSPFAKRSRNAVTAGRSSS